jgi:hypothetical protein
VQAFQGVSELTGVGVRHGGFLGISRG